MRWTASVYYTHLDVYKRQANTQDLMNAEAFAKMKKSAIFLNLGRGPIVVEQDLADALKNNEICLLYTSRCV